MKTGLLNLPLEELVKITVSTEVLRRNSAFCYVAFESTCFNESRDTQEADS